MLSWEDEDMAELKTNAIEQCIEAAQVGVYGLACEELRALKQKIAAQDELLRKAKLDLGARWLRWPADTARSMATVESPFEQPRTRVVYAGGMTRDLGVCDDPASEYFGWLCCRHPDGQWVTLVKITDVMDAIRKEDRHG